MKFFLFCSLLSAFLLGMTIELGLNQTPAPKRPVPQLLQNYQQQIKNSFQRPENANLLFSFITGNKDGISPYTKKAFKKVNLSFLLSPSGIHMSSVLCFFLFFIKKIKPKWPRKAGQISLYASAFLFPQYFALHRLALLRLLLQFKFLCRIKVSLEQIFLLTFILAALLGHYRHSPLSFIYSFFFLATFFSFRDHPKLILMLGLFSTQLIIALFMGEKVSLFSIPCGLLGSFLFALIFPLLLLFLSSFWLIEINWAEPIIRSFVVLVQMTAKGLQGTFTSSSLFLIMAVWVLIFTKSSRIKCALLILFIFLHTNTAMSPVIFWHNWQP